MHDAMPMTAFVQHPVDCSITGRILLSVVSYRLVNTMTCAGTTGSEPKTDLIERRHMQRTAFVRPENE